MNSVRPFWAYKKYVVNGQLRRFSLENFLTDGVDIADLPVADWVARSQWPRCPGKALAFRCVFVAPRLIPNCRPCLQ